MARIDRDQKSGKRDCRPRLSTAPKPSAAALHPWAQDHILLHTSLALKKPFYASQELPWSPYTHHKRPHLQKLSATSDINLAKMSVSLRDLVDGEAELDDDEGDDSFDEETGESRPRPQKGGQIDDSSEDEDDEDEEEERRVWSCPEKLTLLFLLPAHVSVPLSRTSGILVFCLTDMAP